MPQAELLYILTWVGTCLVVSLVAHSAIRDYAEACAAACGAAAVLSVGFMILGAVLTPGFGLDEAWRLYVHLGWAVGSGIMLGIPVSTLVGIPFLRVRRRRHLRTPALPIRSLPVASGPPVAPAAGLETTAERPVEQVHPED
jgi:hypothetical protein